jgi:hypothetical protein
MNKDSKITMGWCDSGTVEGEFAANNIFLISELKTIGIEIDAVIRFPGYFIDKQRDDILESWYSELNSEWLLFIDSDIVITKESIISLIESADENKRQIVSGIYFGPRELTDGLVATIPIIYIKNDEGYNSYLGYPKKSVFEVDGIGMGYCLISRGAIAKFKKQYPNKRIFSTEFNDSSDRRINYVGEDLIFCKNMQSAGIQIFANSNATAAHIKKFAFTERYYERYNEIFRPYIIHAIK